MFNVSLQEQIKKSSTGVPTVTLVSIDHEEISGHRNNIKNLLKMLQIICQEELPTNAD